MSSSNSSSSLMRRSKSLIALASSSSSSMAASQLERQSQRIPSTCTYHCRVAKSWKVSPSTSTSHLLLISLTRWIVSYCMLVLIQMVFDINNFLSSESHQSNTAFIPLSQADNFNNKSMRNIEEKLDQEFVTLLTNIESKYLKFNRHTQIRIEKWVEELVQCDENLVWRKSRNLYIYLLNEMVERDWIGAMFAKMPPVQGIPNFKEGEFKMLMEELKSHPKADSQMKHPQVSMKKVMQPTGDNGTFIATPNCQTERDQFRKENLKLQQPLAIEQEKYAQNFAKPLLLDRETKGQSLLRKTMGLMERNSQKFQNHQQFQNLYEELKRNIAIQEGKNEEQSQQLLVQEGVQNNKLNLFQFGSPRGMTQMQYFRATLQL